MCRIRLAVIVVSLLGARSEPVSAGAELLQLSTESLPRELPKWRELGVQPGDVLLRNEFVSVVVFTAERGEKTPTVGRCLVTPVPDAPGIVFHPGPVELWNKAEAATTAQVAAVRFRHQTDRFAAELTYTVRDGQPWLEISTTVRNLDRDLVLEIPLVDELYVDGKVERDGRAAWYVVPKGNAGVAAILPVQFAVGAYDGPRGQWHLGLLASDPEPSFIKRASARIFHLNRPTSFTPVSVSRDWDRDLRDKEHWHRIAPGQERTATRRLLSAASLEDARTFVQFAAESSRGLQAVPTSSGRQAADRRVPGRTASPSTKSATSSARVATSSAKPAATPPTTRRPTANRPSNERRPENARPEPSRNLPRELPNLDDGPLPSLPARIQEIDRLPPPID